MAEAVDGLDAENLTAWRVYHQTVSRFSHEMRTAAMTLDRLTRDMEGEDFVELTDRLALIFDYLNPPPPEK